MHPAYAFMCGVMFTVILIMNGGLPNKIGAAVTAGVALGWIVAIAIANANQEKREEREEHGKLPE